jgi:ATP-dependent Clp protease ATP-binding subunit ClpB
MKELRKRLADRRITLELSPKAREHIAHEGYDPLYGARPLKRFLQNALENLLAKQLIAGEIHDGAKVTVDVAQHELTLKVVNPDHAASASATS